MIRSRNSPLLQRRNGPECPRRYVENLSSSYGSPLSSAAAKIKLTSKGKRAVFREVGKVTDLVSGARLRIKIHLDSERFIRS